MIHFSPEIGWWSKAIFWYVFINLWMCIGFAVVVFIGGISDLKYLLKAMDEAPTDAMDDGRVVESSDEVKG
ncbi:MAG: hypothetical protein IT448_10975 [Phycisphaerales bacterium]|nr:hypothetical protein [Phycisphaerales bacterium]